MGVTYSSLQALAAAGCGEHLTSLDLFFFGGALSAHVFACSRFVLARLLACLSIFAVAFVHIVSSPQNPRSLRFLFEIVSLISVFLFFFPALCFLGMAAFPAEAAFSPSLVFGNLFSASRRVLLLFLCVWLSFSAAECLFCLVFRFFLCSSLPVFSCSLSVPFVPCPPCMMTRSVSLPLCSSLLHASSFSSSLSLPSSLLSGMPSLSLSVLLCFFFFRSLRVRWISLFCCLSSLFFALFLRAGSLFCCVLFRERE